MLSPDDRIHRQAVKYVFDEWHALLKTVYFGYELDTDRMNAALVEAFEAGVKWAKDFR